jgi:hypothetical protein
MPLVEVTLTQGRSAAQLRSLIHELHEAVVHFTWAGDTRPGTPHYFRIQTERFLIELANSVQSGNHIHSVLRDFKNDLGGLLTAGFPLTGNGVGTPPLRAQAELWADRRQVLRCGTLRPFPAREPRHVRFEELRTDAKRTVREAFRWIRA